MAVELVCPECNAPINETGEGFSGTVDCGTCTTKLLVLDEALTHVDEIPHEDYLGG